MSDSVLLYKKKYNRPGAEPGEAFSIWQNDDGTVTFKVGCKSIRIGETENEKIMINTTGVIKSGQYLTASEGGVLSNPPLGARRIVNLYEKDGKFYADYEV